MVLAILAMGLSACDDPADRPRSLAGADPDRGLTIIRREGCATCHVIPGVRWPAGVVGGSLAGLRARPLIAGRWPNQPDILVQWIIDAPALSPAVGMPPSGLSRAEARDVAAYLYARDAD